MRFYDSIPTGCNIFYPDPVIYGNDANYVTAQWGGNGDPIAYIRLTLHPSWGDDVILTAKGSGGGITAIRFPTLVPTEVSTSSRSYSATLDVYTTGGATDNISWDGVLEPNGRTLVGRGHFSQSVFYDGSTVVNPYDGTLTQNGSTEQITAGDQTGLYTEDDCPTTALYKPTPLGKCWRTLHFPYGIIQLDLVGGEIDGSLSLRPTDDVGVWEDIANPGVYYIDDNDELSDTWHTTYLRITSATTTLRNRFYNASTLALAGRPAYMTFYFDADKSPWVVRTIADGSEEVVLRVTVSATNNTLTITSTGGLYNVTLTSFYPRACPRLSNLVEAMWLSGITLDGGAKTLYPAVGATSSLGGESSIFYWNRDTYAVFSLICAYYARTINGQQYWRVTYITYNNITYTADDDTWYLVIDTPGENLMTADIVNNAVSSTLYGFAPSGTTNISIQQTSMIQMSFNMVVGSPDGVFYSAPASDEVLALKVAEGILQYRNSGETRVILDGQQVTIANCTAMSEIWQTIPNNTEFGTNTFTRETCQPALTITIGEIGKDAAVVEALEFTVLPVPACDESFVAVTYSNIDGSYCKAFGKVVSRALKVDDVTSVDVGTSMFDTPFNSINKRDAVNANESITVYFPHIPRKMYLEDLLLSRYITIDDGVLGSYFVTLEDSEININKDDDTRDYTFTFNLLTHV